MSTVAYFFRVTDVNTHRFRHGGYLHSESISLIKTNVKPFFILLLYFAQICVAAFLFTVMTHQ